MRIVRVFPRRTEATPDDAMAFVGGPPLWQVPCDEVHVSCTFTWDLKLSDRLRNEWQSAGYNVRLGGPAYYDHAGEFAPGMYLRHGYTITSRGCIRHCPECLVPTREGPIRELPIMPGWIVQDNQLCGCSENHFVRVCEMLAGQRYPAEFTGGLDARLMTAWHVGLLAQLRITSLFTAYDHPSQANPMRQAVAMLRGAGLKHRQVYCYVLMGYKGDTMQAAEKRCREVFDAGAVPYAMYYCPPTAKGPDAPGKWRSFVRDWRRPAIIFSMAKDRSAQVVGGLR